MLVLSVIAGIINFRVYDTGVRILLFLLTITLVSELMSLFLLETKERRYTAYHFYNVMELSVLSLYFLKVTGLYKLWRFLSLAVLFIVAGILNAVYLQPIHTLNSNFLSLESFLVICMSLYSIYKMLLNDEIDNIAFYPHFWISAFLLLYFSTTFVYWSFIKMLYATRSPYYTLAEYIEIIMNIVCYTGLFFILIYYRKMIKK